MESGNGPQTGAARAAPVTEGHQHHEGANSGNKGAIAHGGNAEIHDRVSLYVAILALLAAGLGLGFEISRAMSDAKIQRMQDQNSATNQRLQDQAIDAKIQAGVARAEATAHAADVNARVAVDEIERMRTALAAQKIVIPKSHD